MITKFHNGCLGHINTKNSLSKQILENNKIKEPLVGAHEH